MINSLARSIVLRQFNRSQGLSLIFCEGDRKYPVSPGARPVEVRVLDGRFWWEILLRGSIGAGISHGRGWWECDELGELTTRIALAEDYLARWGGGPQAILARAERILERFRSNSLSGSRRNIAAHYDLGNDFFEAWLDPGMQYSSALWPSPEADLETAQRNKAEVIAQRLQLQPGMRILEIGCGWGDLAIYLAKHHQCEVVALTISERQAAVVARRVAEEKLEGQIELRVQDYRKVEGVFDRVLSIEMIEAVGDDWLDLYLSKIDSLLKPGGFALLQAILIRNELYEGALARVDFIRKCIFPGSFIPSLDRIRRGLPQGQELEVLQEFGADYARTLAAWRERISARAAQLDALGYEPWLRRQWEFYLAYCEGGFRAERLGVAHLRLSRTATDPTREVGDSATPNSLEATC